MNEWVFVSIFISVLGIFALINIRRSEKELIKKSKQRGVITKNKFIGDLEKRGFERNWITILFDMISDYVPKNDFKMSVDDKLVEDYRIDEEDLVDIANELFLKRNGFTAQEVDIKKAEQFGASIHTFEGILLFITLEKYQ